MKRVMWALVAAGVFLVGAAIGAEAAGASPRGGYHGRGSGWSGGVPGGSAWVRGGYHGVGRTHAVSPRGSVWIAGGGARYHGGMWRGGTRVFIGGGVGWWAWPGWWGPGWWGYPYPYYAAPPVAIQPGPTTYIQQAPAPTAQDYWYYCQQAGAYYPYVKECPGGWMQVVPPPAPPDR
jgi:hypothetical protein